MFEKEAEEYAKKRAKELWINECNLAYATMERAFRKGAEFGYKKGYKKGFEECAKARLNTTTISDCPIHNVDWKKMKKVTK